MERPFRDDFFLSSFKLTASIYYHFEKKIEFLEDPHKLIIPRSLVSKFPRSIPIGYPIIDPICFYHNIFIVIIIHRCVEVVRRLNLTWYRSQIDTLNHPRAQNSL